MAAIETALRTRLATFPGTAALLIGGDGILRVYPLKLPALPTLPAIAYTLISDDNELNHSGYPSRLWARYQFDIWADSYAGMVALADAVVAAFHGFRGTVDGVRIDQGRKLSAHDDYDEEAKKWRRIADFGFGFSV